MHEKRGKASSLPPARMRTAMCLLCGRGQKTSGAKTVRGAERPSFDYAQDRFSFLSGRLCRPFIFVVLAQGRLRPLFILVF